MFRDVSRVLRELEGTHSLPVSVEVDDDGYLDRQCHEPDCMFRFKVHVEDWLKRVGDESVCPLCGHFADSAEWSTQEQTEHFKTVAIAQVGKPIRQALRRDGDRWNRTQPRNSFVRVTMRVEGRPLHVTLPPAAADPMQLKIECSECGCHYAVIGTAFFCPSCGNSDAEVVFRHTLSGLRGTIGALADVRAAISDPDTAENMVRTVIENGLQNTVTAFQRYAEALYFQMEPQSNPRRNSFQSLSRGSALWCAATGKHYSDFMSAAEISTLKRAFQQRHLLAHTQGIVDQGYIDLSGDTSHQLGERVLVREEAVLIFLDAVDRLVEHLRSSAKGRMSRAGDSSSPQGCSLDT